MDVLEAALTIIITMDVAADVEEEEDVVVDVEEEDVVVEDRYCTFFL